jgi:hypothetical protein
MKLTKSIFDIGVNPCFQTVVLFFGTIRNDPGKGLVSGHGKPVLLYRFGQRA